MIPTTLPHGRGRRLGGQPFPRVRAAVAERCGSPVVAAASQDAGFTPGFASVLTCEDGSRHFVKAASVKAQRTVADAYREEARKLGALPAGAPPPGSCGPGGRLGGPRAGVRRVPPAAAPVARRGPRCLPGHADRDGRG